MTPISPLLFNWDAIEARSDLDRFYLVRDHLPDVELIQRLEAIRASHYDGDGCGSCYGWANSANALTSPADSTGRLAYRKQ